MAVEFTETALGQIAIRRGYLTQRQVDRCAELQQQMRTQGAAKPLGQIFLDQGFLTPEDLQGLLELQQFAGRRAADIRFGTITVENRFATRAQVHECLLLQEKLFLAGKTIPIGQLLAEKGFLSVQQVQAVLEVQRRLDAIPRPAVAAPMPAPSPATAPEPIPDEVALAIGDFQMVSKMWSASAQTPPASAVRVLLLKGGLQGDEALCALDRHLAELVAGGQVRILLDLEGVPFLPSKAVGIFLKASSRVSQGKGKLVLCSVSDRNLVVLERMNIRDFIPIYPNLASTMPLFFPA